MMGPGLCSLFLCSLVALSFLQAAKSKPLSAVLRVQSHEEPGAVARFRRDALPYEGEMFAYPPAEPGRNEAFYPQLASEAALARLGLSAREREQVDRLGQALGRAEKPGGGGGQEADERLGQALQQLVEDGRRRDQEAAYLNNLLRAWNELGQPEAYPAEATEADLRSGYLDYDELAPARAGVGNRRLTELARYGNRDAAYNVPARPDLEGPLDGGKEVEEQVMRYLVGRILANMDANSDAARPPRLVKRELLSLAETRPSGQAVYAAGARRTRRALDEGVVGQANLLRVKRLGAGTVYEEGEDEDEEKFPAQGPKEVQLAGGLQRMKRIDGQFQDTGMPVQSRRYAGY